MRSSVAEDMKDIMADSTVARVIANALTSAELRYARNKVFASYGYPFKNPFVRAQFYYEGSPYKESTSFSDQKMTKEHLAYVEFLLKLEADKLKEDD